MGFPAKEVMGLHLSVGSNPALSAKLKQFIFARKFNLGLVAQLDRASVYGTEGSGFESLWAHQRKPTQMSGFLYYCIKIKL